MVCDLYQGLSTFMKTLETYIQAPSLIFIVLWVNLISKLSVDLSVTLTDMFTLSSDFFGQWLFGPKADWSSKKGGLWLAEESSRGRSKHPGVYCKILWDHCQSPERYCTPHYCCQGQVHQTAVDWFWWITHVITLVYYWPVCEFESQG